MEGNFADKALETKSVQPLFDELEKNLNFLPNDEEKKHLSICLLTFYRCSISD